MSSEYRLFSILSEIETTEPVELEEDEVEDEDVFSLIEMLDALLVVEEDGGERFLYLADSFRTLSFLDVEEIRAA